MRNPTRNWLVAVLLVVAVVGLLVARHRAVDDLRRLERVYLEARQPTACANAALAPSAFTPKVDELPGTVLRLVEEARQRSADVRAKYVTGNRSTVPLPALRKADRMLRRDLDAQVALYEVMVDDPKSSDDELVALGGANNAVERELQRARRQLLSGAASGWDRRFVCRR